jgi:hypothetical protein
VEEILERGLWSSLRAVGATSLANVGAQVVPPPNDPPCGKKADREQTAVGIQVEERAHTDV